MQFPSTKAMHKIPMSIQYRNQCQYTYALNERAVNNALASPCETLRRNCKREQGRCRTVLQVQVQVLGRCRTEQGLHKRVQGGPRTLQSRPQKSSSQRPCLQKVSKLSQIIFKLRPNEAGNVDVIVTYIEMRRQHLPSMKSRDPAKRIEKNKKIQTY